MNATSQLKGAGYLVSALSVILLGAVSWHATRGQPWMRGMLIAGMATSVVGMVLRWISHRREQREEGKS